MMKQLFFTFFLIALTMGTIVMCEARRVPVQNGQLSEVEWLPGWPRGSPLPARTFSGFFHLKDDIAPQNSEMRMHYVAYLSQREPATDPVIVWWNGGPGATSAWGLFVENGPLLLNAESLAANETIPRLIENPYAWTRFASIIAFANPPPVGFSYCTPPGPTGNGTACGTWNDTRVGVINAEALHTLFHDHMPNLLFNSDSKRLYFMSESYGSVFVGEALRVMLANGPRFSSILKHLHGFAIGDGCLGGDVLCGGSGAWWELFFLYGHAQIPTTMWNSLLTTCGGEAALKKRGPYAPECEAAITRVHTAVGGYFAYNLYDECPNNVFKRAKGRLATVKPLRRRFETESVHTEGPIGPVPLFTGYWCPETVFQQYMDRADVRRALDVPLDSNFFNADDGNGMSYDYTCRTIMPTIAALVENTTGVIPHPVEVSVFEADADPSVNVFETQDIWFSFAATRNYTESASWSAWTIGSNIVGGYQTSWKNGALRYTTFRGKGHMLALYGPLPAQVYAYSFTQSLPIPPYKPSG